MNVMGASVGGATLKAPSMAGQLKGESAPSSRNSARVWKNSPAAPTATEPRATVRVTAWKVRSLIAGASEPINAAVPSAQNTMGTN